LHAYDTVSEARTKIASYLEFCNARRPHSRIDRRTRDEAYLDVPSLKARLNPQSHPLKNREKLSDFVEPLLPKMLGHESRREAPRSGSMIARNTWQEARFDPLSEGSSGRGGKRSGSCRVEIPFTSLFCGASDGRWDCGVTASADMLKCQRCSLV
jgi:hypothetical protein